MRYYAANGVPVTEDWTPQATFPTQNWFDTPMTKLDAFINGTDVVFQLLLSNQEGWSADRGQEVLMRMGFNSRDPLPGFYAVRFKVWEKTFLASTGTIDLSVFAV